jgi:LacI family transcriptional regulator
MMAVGCLQALSAAGVRVPEDVAVAGFDDVPIARYLDLTTARIGIADMGARAVVRLIEWIAGTSQDAAIEMYTPELVVRGTTHIAAINLAGVAA